MGQFDQCESRSQESEATKGNNKETMGEVGRMVAETYWIQTWEQGGRCRVSGRLATGTSASGWEWEGW